jgi:cobalt-zinc-cadmium efflux system outer membrane protein
VLPPTRFSMPTGFSVPHRGGALGAALALLISVGPAHAQPAAPADTLTLDAALARARALSPAVRAAALEVEARRALAVQAGRRPNPTLDLDGENVGASGGERPQATLSAALPIELGGDRAARRDLATREVDLAAADLTLTGLALDAAVRARYAEAAGAQARADLARFAFVLADSAVAVTTEQVDAGDRSPVDQTRAEVARAEVGADAARADAQRRAALARLAALFGAAPDFGAVAPLAEPTPVLPLDTLLARLDRSPALTRFDAEAARRRAALRLEEARRTPDPTVSAGYRQFFGGDGEDGGAGGALVAGVSLPLPLFDRNGGAVEAARVRLGAVDAEREAARLDARAALLEAYGALDAAFAESEALRTGVLPGAEDVAARVEEGYREGKFALLDVLDAQRTLVAARTRYADARAAYARAAADVERITALPLFAPAQP